MLSQLLRPLALAVILIMTINVGVFAQFPYKVDAGSKPKGKIDSVITTFSNQNKTVEVFDKKRQLVEFDEYRYSVHHAVGVIRDTTRIIYLYDKKGLLSKSISIRRPYYPQAQFKLRADTIIWTFIKNGAGYVAKFDDHNSDGSTAQRTYKLNEAFQLIEQSVNPVGSNQNGFYEYDKNGYLIKQTMVLPPPYHIKNEKYYTNDANGNIITEATPNRTFKYFYTRFDKMGNWLEVKIYKLDAEDFEDYLLNKEDYLWGKQERRITYYK